MQLAGGYVGGLYGRPYTVYRMTSNANVSILSVTPAIDTYYALPNRITSRDMIENSTLELLVFEVDGDARLLQRGDLVVESGYESDQGMYAVAQLKPLQTPIWIRCDSFATLTRQVGLATEAELPTSGSTALSGWDEADESDASAQTVAHVLTLVNGVYALAAPGDGVTPATIPIGIQPTSRAGMPHLVDLPTSNPRDRLAGYIPPLVGVDGNEFVIQENDELSITVGSDVYIVSLRYESSAGTVGSILLLEKDAA
jgi:hypothetical protein